MSFNYDFKKACIEDFRFNDLRHTFASRLVMKGASLKVVQELLVHRDIKMTLRYVHLSPDHKKRRVDMLFKKFQTATKSYNKRKEVGINDL